MRNKILSKFWGRRGLRVFLFAGIAACLLFLGAWGGCLFYNNVSFGSDEVFERRLDAAIVAGERWVVEHEAEIRKNANAAMLTMLRECDEIHRNADFADTVAKFMGAYSSHYSRCWRLEIDPNYAVNERNLREAFDNEIIDYKWCLYGAGSEYLDVDANELGLFELEKWQGRQLTHQLFGLTLLRERSGSNEKLERVIDHLCERLSDELYGDMAVVDIYIQKVMFTLRAERADLIKRRWVERIIANQNSDGGWDDKWFLFDSRGRRLKFGGGGSNEHATVQAVEALYLVKYKYGEHFGL